jgi:hypothetical protein
MKLEQNKSANLKSSAQDAVNLEMVKHNNKMKQIRLTGKLKSAGELLLEQQKDDEAQGKFIAEAVIAELAKQTDNSQKPAQSQNNS